MTPTFGDQVDEVAHREGVAAALDETKAGKAVDVPNGVVAPSEYDNELPL